MHLLSPETLDAAIAYYGYLAVFMVIGLESMGLPLPGEATLISAAVFAATRGGLSLPLIIVAAAAGAIVGDNIGFLIGRRFGLPLLIRYGGHVGLGQGRLKLGQYLFGRYGGPIVFFGRFIAVLRALAAVLAGANRYPWRKFLLFNAAGGILWATLYGCAAYAVGSQIHRVEGPVGLVAGIVVLALAVPTWRFLRRHEARLTAEAEAAMPGPLKA